MSTLGVIECVETIWRKGRGETVRAFCVAAKVNPRGNSRRLARALVDFGADHAFATAAAKVQEHYGVKVSVNRVRQGCVQAACRMPPPLAVGTLPAGGPEWIVTETDGTMLPMVDTSQAPAGADRRKHRRTHWQEARLSAARAQGSATARYGYSRSDTTDAGVAWARTTAQAGWGTASRLHAVGDGAAWIVEQARAQFGPRGTYLLDLYHVCDYLATAAPDPNQSRTYVQAHKQALQANRSSEVLAELPSRLEPHDLPDEDAPVRRAHRYLANRPEQLDYAFALAHDLPVGSGLIEGGHRHVLQARLKRSGAWWSPPTADAIAKLRILRANGQWLSLWRN